MKSPLITVAYFSMLVFHTQPAEAQFDPSTSDAWDVNNGGMVTANSALNLSNASDMFGAVTISSVEPGNVIYQDGQAQGFVHFIEWTAPTEITLRSIVLNIAHDGPPFDANARGISEFIFYALNPVEGVFETVFQYTPANPYGTSEPPANGGIRTNMSNNELSVCVNVPPTTAQEFRAEFIQFGGAGPASGPRIFELDGYEETHLNCIASLFESGFEAGEG